jgi:hypothetical protein
MVSRTRFITLVVSAVFVVGCAASLRAQSLGDIAREEEARRKEVKQPAKVYTNKDLPNVPPAPAPPDTVKPAAGPEDPEKGSGKDGKGKDAPVLKDEQSKDKDGKTDAKDKGAVKDQAYWSGRMKELRTALDRDQTFAEAMQSRINGLTADFSARDDPAQRDAIGRDRQKALDELDRLKKAIQTEKQALADFEEEARRAAVPPGWLR